MSFPLAGLLFAAGAAVAYSGLDLSRKLLMDRMRALPLLFYTSVGQLPFFLAWVAFTDSWQIDTAYYLPGGGSIALNIVANLLFLLAVRMSPLSATIPFLSLTPVFVTLLAVPLLGEVPSPRQSIGILVVVVGAFRLNLESGEGLSAAAGWRALGREKGSLLMVAVAFLWALATPLDKLAMAASGPPWHGLALNAGVGLGCGVLLVARGRTRELGTDRRNIGLLVLNVLLSVVALAFLLLALTQVWAGIVESIKRAVGSALAVVLGWSLLAESVNAHKLGAIGLMTVGVLLILL